MKNKKISFIALLSIFLLVMISSSVLGIAIAEKGDSVIFTESASKPLAFVLDLNDSPAECAAKENTCYDRGGLSHPLKDCRIDGRHGYCQCEFDVSQSCGSASSPIIKCTSGSVRCSGNDAQVCNGGSWVRTDRCSAEEKCEKVSPTTATCFKKTSIVERDPKGEATETTPINIGAVECSQEGKQSCETVSVGGKEVIAPSTCASGVLRNKGYYCAGSTECSVQSGVSDCYESQSLKQSSGASAVNPTPADVSDIRFLSAKDSGSVQIIGYVAILLGVILGIFVNPYFLIIAAVGLVLVVGGKLL